jgi:hypothetical protein
VLQEAAELLATFDFASGELQDARLLRDGVVERQLRREGDFRAA